MTLYEANELAYTSQGSRSEPVTLAGRVTTESNNGELMLVRLRDGSGPDLHSEISCAISGSSDAVWSTERWRREISPGDHISVTGALALTVEHGPLLRAQTWSVLTKAARPFPGAALTEQARHTHLLLDPEARRMLIARARGVASLRETLEAEDFIEIETPVLEPAATESPERPFRTQCDSLDVPLYLRTSSEYYLKRLFAAGFDRVFELARSFRDEELDATHNIEYTLLEVYRAYDDYVGMRRLTQELVCAAADAALGTTVVSGPRAERLDLRDEWAVVPIHVAVGRAVGENITPDGDRSRLRAIARDHGLAVHDAPSDDHLVLSLYERLVEPETARPTFYTDFPRTLAPLARSHPTQQRLAQKWDLVIFGREVAAAYSELVDPAEQRTRLERQQPSSPEDRKPVDVEFLDALEVGVPPTGGLVVGVDRLVMTLTGATDISEVIPFPLAAPS